MQRTRLALVWDGSNATTFLTTLLYPLSAPPRKQLCRWELSGTITTRTLPTITKTDQQLDVLCPER